ncbi:MAG: murein biosynthesis integral membrane protein MurJ [Anaerolineales bacterium]|jgi:putative peptidoglycan lipid II flippase
MAKTQLSANRQIVRASGIVMLGYILSTAAGLAAQILISRAFGTSSELDAYVAANRVPEFLFTIISGGALASAFLPTFARFLTRGDKEGAWSLASSIINLVIIVLGLLSGLAALFAPGIVRLLAPGFSDPGQIQLTISLLRVMLLSPLIFGVSGLLMATLNAHQHFIFPALAPASYRLGQILGVLLLARRMGIFGLAWGTVIGAALHLLVQLPAFLMLRPRLGLTLGLHLPAVREVGRLLAPRLLGVAVVQLNFIVNTIIASGQPEGSLAALTFAFALMIMPQAVIAQAVAVASLPTFSAQVARGEWDALRNSVGSALRGVLYLALPASIGLVMLRTPLVTLLLERGLFDARSTDLVAWALLWYAAGLVFHSLLEVVVRAFYAQYDTRTPVIVTTLAMSLNIALSLLLADIFSRAGLPPHGGLALANSSATALETTTLLILLSRRMGGLDLRRLRKGLVATGAASGLLALGLWVWLSLTRGAAVWLQGGLGVILGLGAYWAMTWALGAPEARRLPGMLLRRRYDSGPESVH